MTDARKVAIVTDSTADLLTEVCARAGISVVPLAEVWGLQSLGGPVRGLLDFVSGIYFISALITSPARWRDQSFFR